jgi:hypothetical protein
MTPPNFASLAGRCLPSIVAVALGDPASPVVSRAVAGVHGTRKAELIHRAADAKTCRLFMHFLHILFYAHGFSLSALDSENKNVSSE